MPTLEDATRRLYDAFTTVPKPHRIDGCPCCIDRKKIGVLLTKPLRDLTPDDLSAYASSVFLTVGDTADFLYFLPRILEINALDPNWWPNPQITGRAIRTAKPETWTPVQRAVVTDYLDAVARDAVRSGEVHRMLPTPTA